MKNNVYCEECEQHLAEGFVLTECISCRKKVCPDCTNYINGPCVECAKETAMMDWAIEQGMN